MGIFQQVKIYVLLISIAYGATIITPTNETNTMQYYRASLDTSPGNGFQLGDIVCAANKDCNIYCDMNNGCQWTNINAKNANNLFIDCSGMKSACSLLVVDGPLSLQSSVNIYCRSDKACEQATFSVNNSAIVNIFCSNASTITQSSCELAKIYATNNNNKVNITCGTYDCHNMQLWTQPFSYNTFLDCTGTDSCTDTHINCITGNGSSMLSYNNNTNDWECSIDYCCPIISNPQITCPSEPFCVINCTNSINNCMNTYIDGTDTMGPLIQMDIYCNGNNNCQSSKILCPQNANCNIECNKFESCKNTLIDASFANELNLICGDNGCDNAYILCPSNENSCNIDCRGLPNSCYNMQIIQLTNTLNTYLNIICPTPSTNPSFINACKNIRFQCEYGTIYYDSPNQFDDLKTKCIESIDDIIINQCCPWPILAPTTAAPTASPVELIFLYPTSSPTLIDNTPSGKEESDSELLLYILVIGCIVLILCVGFWMFMWYRKRSNENMTDTESGIRNSRSLKKDNKGKDENRDDAQSLNVPQIQSQLEIEKSMEMQSTSHRTITDYNPGAQSTTSMYQRNISNPPQNNRQQLGLADLGNSGWDD